MGKVKIRHYVIRRKNRAYWIPTATMKRAGFTSIPLGPDGPLAWEKAHILNSEWDRVRRGISTSAEPKRMVEASISYPTGSIGEAMQRFRMTSEWIEKKTRTKEDWERAWKYIGPVFAQQKPSHITLEIISEWRKAIVENKGVREAHRALKIWRAFWRIMIAMDYCRGKADPSMAMKNHAAKGRSSIYSEGEIIRLVKTAIRSGYYGYACIVAIMWDGALSPVDGRTIAAAQMRKDKHGTWFEYQRGKTGRSGVIALTDRAERLISWYLDKIFHGLDIAPGTTIFRTRRGAAYTKNSLAEDHRDIRGMVFTDDKRVLLDIRRSASTEAIAGGVEDTHLSAMMANSISESKALEQTYAPIQVQTVRKANKARGLGRDTLRANK